jgi:hypothetical protein
MTHVSCTVQNPAADEDADGSRQNARLRQWIATWLDPIQTLVPPRSITRRHPLDRGQHNMMRVREQIDFVNSLSPYQAI